ncbi:MAG: hypothetical protein PHV34_08490 [Verrucomicrobiae bacterium]|nr:hypothetical protein [Verrucomicrobiae bacterium]
MWQLFYFRASANLLLLRYFIQALSPVRLKRIPSFQYFKVAKSGKTTLPNPRRLAGFLRRALVPPACAAEALAKTQARRAKADRASSRQALGAA